MDSEKRNEDVNPTQKELDLGFNQIEPITPKKVIKQETSILQRAKGLKELFRKNEQPPQFNLRREPTIGSFNSANTTTSTQENFIQTEETPLDVVTENHSESIDTPETESNTNSTESVSTGEKNKLSLKNPENWAVLQKLPQKHRRLFIVLFIAILLLLFMFWLKPNTDTVDSVQQQNGANFPVEFQPISQDQSVQSNEPNTGIEMNAPNTEENKVDSAQTLATSNNTVVQNNIAPNTQDNQQTTTVENNVQPKLTEVKPENQTSQTLEKNVTETPKTNVEQSKTTKERNHGERTKAEKILADKKLTQLVLEKSGNKKLPPVVDAKPEKQTRKTMKTLTIPTGVSLMQVFRDNHLNISDVNAMSKAKGAGNTLSSLKAGERVQVTIGNGKVNELRLNNGARFIRQADGSYIYKK